MAGTPDHPASGAQFDFEVAASAARTGTTIHGPLDNLYYRGVSIYVEATASSGDATEDLQVTIRAVDPVTGNKVVLIQDTPFTNGATGTAQYLIYPGAIDNQASFNGIEEVPLASKWEVETQVLQGGGGPDYTYSIGAAYHR